MSTYYYVRVSTNNQTTENQVLAMSTKYAAPTEVFDDSGVSGKTPAMERPAFSRMLDIVKAGDTVVCYAISRIGRTASDTLAMVEKFQELGVSLVSHTEGFDAATPVGKMMVTMLAGFAELEREQIVERVNAGLNTARANGVKLGRSYSDNGLEARRMLAEGATVAEVMSVTGISKAQAYKLKKAVSA